jgi:hypothetical protein
VAAIDAKAKNEGSEVNTATETGRAQSKAPWRPKVSGYIAFFLGPVAGAFVAAASLRRMGESRKARATLLYTLVLCVAFLVPFILLIPPGAGIKKIILLAVEGAGFSVFPSIVREEYAKWRPLNPNVKPRNDYLSIGWGILGLLVYVTMMAVVDAYRLLR